MEEDGDGGTSRGWTSPENPGRSRDWQQEEEEALSVR